MCLIENWPLLLFNYSRDCSGLGLGAEGNLSLCCYQLKLYLSCLMHAERVRMQKRKKERKKGLTIRDSSTLGSALVSSLQGNPRRFLLCCIALLPCVLPYHWKTHLLQQRTRGECILVQKSFYFC